MTKEISLCPNCYCMTKTIKGKCGKCKKMKINNQIKSEQSSSIILKNRMKEIEKERDSLIAEAHRLNNCRNSKYKLNKRKEIELRFNDLKPQLKLLKQFQKEIKEVQEELKEEIGCEINCMLSKTQKENVRNIFDKIFKNKFGEIK